MSDLAERLELLTDRLRRAYDGIGHSTGRPYVYVVYPPEQERLAQRLADEQWRSGDGLWFAHVDLLRLTIDALAGDEKRYQELLAAPAVSRGDAAQGILRRWTRVLRARIVERLAEPDRAGRPVVVLRGLAALHPIGDPTGLMEALAEDEPRDPATGRIVPIVVLTPGVRPPATSRTYDFLGREDLRLSFYRGEEA